MMNKGHEPVTDLAIIPYLLAKHAFLNIAPPQG
jgi:hypothetical protein